MFHNRALIRKLNTRIANRRRNRIYREEMAYIDRTGFGFYV